jgi:GNAT superfamily N-acetyltransferase
MEIALSHLDHARFGVITSKGIIEHAHEVEMHEQWCMERNVKFSIVRVATHNVRAAQALEQAEYRLMDTLIYYRGAATLGRDASVILPPNYSIAVQTPPINQDLGRLAAICFNHYTGHYHSDQNIVPELANAVYESWAERSAQVVGVADTVITIHDTSQRAEPNLAGFATLKSKDNACEGVLFCVHPVHKGMGLHRALVSAALKQTWDNGLSSFYSSSQINNVAVQRNWVREGMLPESSWYTFHLWRA